MLYLATSPSYSGVVDLLDRRRLGLMCQPGTNHPRVGWLWGADNACHRAECFDRGCAATGYACVTKWDEARWLRWLRSENLPRPGALFATAPDTVGDAALTIDRFVGGAYTHLIRAARYPVALVAQDGMEDLEVPWADLDVLFIGGSTDWKLGEGARAVAAEARARGKWVHVGRVNSSGRYRAWAPDADSADGSFLSFGPDQNLPRLMRWLVEHEGAPTLWEGAPT